MGGGGSGYNDGKGGGSTDAGGGSAGTEDEGQDPTTTSVEPFHQEGAAKLESPLFCDEAYHSRDGGGSSAGELDTNDYIRARTASMSSSNQQNYPESYNPYLSNEEYDSGRAVSSVVMVRLIPNVLPNRSKSYH